MNTFFILKKAFHFFPKNVESFKETNTTFTDKNDINLYKSDQ